jgi:hypothetical protein
MIGLGEIPCVQAPCRAADIFSVRCVMAGTALVTGFSNILSVLPQCQSHATGQSGKYGKQFPDARLAVYRRPFEALCDAV